MSTPPQQRSSAGLGWVTLDDGVVYSRAWLTTNTPGLFAAWGRAQTQQQRQRLVAEIQQVAAAMESVGKPREEYVPVRIQWAETTRYEAELYLVPNSSEDEIWSEIANLPDEQRRTLDVTDEDNRIISVVDLDGDGIASVLERATGDGNTVDWGDLADSIDEQIAESPGWPALNAALTAAAASGYDVAAGLPQLAEQAPLPVHDPAGELHHRLLNTTAGPSSGDDGAGSDQSAQPPRREEPPRYASTPALTSVPGV